MKATLLKSTSTSAPPITTVRRGTLVAKIEPTHQTDSLAEFAFRYVVLKCGHKIFESHKSCDPEAMRRHAENHIDLLWRSERGGD